MDRFSEYAEEQEASSARKTGRGLLRRILAIGLGAALGVAIGIGLGASGLSLPVGDAPGDFLCFLAGFFALFWLASLVQTVLHEAGHLVFGLATGYRFCSFTVGGLMLVRTGGRLRLRVLSLAGMGGQCLMAPPAGVRPEELPFILYNLGGVLMNLLAAAVCGALVPLTVRTPLLAFFFLLLALIGLLFAATNGIPMRTELIDNDGKNVASLAKNPAARRALWLQLSVNEQLTQGLRLREMPEEWFALPEEAQWDNSLLVTLAVFRANRLLDAHEIDGAAALMDRLFAANTAMAGLHRYLLVCDRIFCALLQGDADAAARLCTKRQRQFMRRMQLNPGVLRTEYALCLLHDGSAARAEKCLALFEARAGKHPYPQEIASERELMALAAEQCAARGDETPAAL